MDYLKLLIPDSNLMLQIRQQLSRTHAYKNPKPQHLLGALVSIQQHVTIVLDQPRSPSPCGDDYERVVSLCGSACHVVCSTENEGA